MNALLVLVAAGVAMWSLRASAIVLAGGRTLPERWNRALGYSKHAVLASIVAASLAAQAGRDGAGATPALIAAGVTVAVGRYGRRPVPAMLAGMATAACAGLVV